MVSCSTSSNNCLLFINSYVRFFFFHITSVVFILAVRTEVARLLLVAKKLGMLEGDFAFVTLDFYISESLEESLRNTTWFQSWEEMLGVFEGLITLSVKKPGDEELRNITKRLNDGLRNMPQFQNDSATSSVNIILTLYTKQCTYRFYSSKRIPLRLKGLNTKYRV